MAKNLNITKKQIFTFRAPEAKSVKLAADFTQWQKNAIALKRQRDGTWSAGVELPLGTYQYRFLVDGEWQDDMACATRVPNPFGGQNAVCKVTEPLQHK